MMYTTEFLKRAREVHIAHGLKFRYSTRKGGKQYIKIAGDSRGKYWSSHKMISDHIKKIFPGAVHTSGVWAGSEFEATFRINP